MTFGIIAAGEGSRLWKEGVTTPKPLVGLGGEPLIDRLLRIFNGYNPARIAVICNDLHKETASHIRNQMAVNVELARRVQLIVKTTPSSMHSFYELSPYLSEADVFCVSTVDTIFSETAFASYLKHLQTCVADGYDGCMGVTDYIDDESPLYVETDNQMNIVNFLDKPSSLTPLHTSPEGASPHPSRYVSAGIYGLTPKAIDVLTDCIKRGEQRMRNYQRALLRAGLRLKAFPMGKVMDVDHLGDIAKAEKFLSDEK